MTTLIAGFDSAWTPNNSGSIVGVVQSNDGFQELGPPIVANFKETAEIVAEWQSQYEPALTRVLLDQPTIVMNPSGQRPVENLVASPVSLRYGGVQPANTGREDMFGERAPVWEFLSRFGGAANPLEGGGNMQVFETYPVLAIIALEWTLPDSRSTGRLPKYNPERRKTFALSDWIHLCDLVAAEFNQRGLNVLADWANAAAQLSSPRKHDQDGIDACLCLLVALQISEGSECLMVGDLDTGYIVVPYGEVLALELKERCDKTGRNSSDWVRSFRI